MFGYIVLGLLVGGGGYFIGKKLAENSAQSESSTGEIYAIGLSGIPAHASNDVNAAGFNLARAMGWDPNNILDGVLSATPQGQHVLTLAWKPDAVTPQMPVPGFTFHLGDPTTAALITVTFVQKQPARVQNAFT